MIPKIIHYCWFGKKPLPELAIKCISSWKQILPEYEIREWNEDNFDVNCCEYVREAYEAQKWAFVSDYARLYAMVTYGGIYMDTDVEVLKPLDSYLQYQAFSGFQTEKDIPTGIMACEKGFSLFYELLHDYDTRRFKKSDGSYDVLYTNVYAITDACLKKGLILNNTFQVIEGFAIFPQDVFCAKDYRTRKVQITENTVTVHHFAGSWAEADYKLEVSILEKTRQWRIGGVGRLVTVPFRVVRRIKREGMGKAMSYYLKRNKG